MIDVVAVIMACMVTTHGLGSFMKPGSDILSGLDRSVSVPGYHGPEPM